MGRPTIHFEHDAKYKYIAVNGQIFRNTAAPANAPILMKIYPYIEQLERKKPPQKKRT